MVQPAQSYANHRRWFPLFHYFALPILTVHVVVTTTGLLRQRHIVWQIEVSPSMMAAAGRSVDELCALAGRHFTHVRELRSRTAARSQPVSRLRELLAPLRDRQFTNLLLHNRS